MKPNFREYVMNQIYTEAGRLDVARAALKDDEYLELAAKLAEIAERLEEIADLMEGAED